MTVNIYRVNSQPDNMVLVADLMDRDRGMANQERKKLVGERLRAARAAQRPRPWTQDRLVYELEQAGRRAKIDVPSRSSSKVRVSRWENGHSYPDQVNRELLRIVFRATDEALGFSSQGETATIDAKLEPVPFQAEWTVAFEQVTSDWGSDMERRDFLRGTAFMAAASTLPALQWLTGSSEVIEKT